MLSEEARRKLVQKAAVQRSERPLSESDGLLKRELSWRPKVPKLGFSGVMLDFGIRRFAMSCCAIMLILCMVFLPAGMQMVSGRMVTAEPVRDDESGTDGYYAALASGMDSDSDQDAVFDGGGVPFEIVSADQAETRAGEEEISDAASSGGVSIVPDEELDAQEAAGAVEQEQDEGEQQSDVESGVVVDDPSGDDGVQDQDGDSSRQQIVAAKPQWTGAGAGDPLAKTQSGAQSSGVVVIPESDADSVGTEAASGDEAESESQSAESEGDPVLPDDELTMDVPPELPVEDDMPEWLRPVPENPGDGLPDGT